jgi:hypothetical protein
MPWLSLKSPENQWHGGTAQADNPLIRRMHSLTGDDGLERGVKLPLVGQIIEQDLQRDVSARRRSHSLFDVGIRLNPGLPARHCVMANS